jgi:hypothetical protein
MEVKETQHTDFQETDTGERRINQYILKHVLGKGAFGVVSLAVENTTGQEYVRWAAMLASAPIANP